MKSGDTLGAYSILQKLGEGGMGVVYRARDTRLNRDVALKVLPGLFADDPDRLARFRREAQTLATLNHPNIAQIHGYEEASANGPAHTGALVMELVEGDDLSVLISRGPIPLDDLVPIARQIAEALEAAHELGIVHRDLKPANIKVRPDGVVKVLDFGLAKALGNDSDSGALDAMRSPTLTARATQMGVILGTAAYMAPEQAKGRPVDRRADIWAFGVILHEMLTGRRLFEADSIPETLAHVITREVDLSALPSDVPPHLRTLVARCLVKDPKQRLRDVGEARLALGGGENLAQPPASSTPMRSPSRWREAAAWTLVALLGGAAAYQAWTARRSTAAPAVLRLNIPLEVSPILGGLSLALAPDGHALVIQAPWRSGDRRLALRRLDATGVEMLPGTENGNGPSWSPDSRAIAFIADGQLKRFDLSTSSVRRLSPGPQLVLGMAWGEGTILVVPPNGPLIRVQANGGEPEPLTLDSAAGEIAHAWPVFLPDGRRFFYQSVRTGAGARMMLASLDSEARTELVADELRMIAAYEQHVVYRRDDSIYAQRIDYDAPELLGEPTLLSADVEFNIWAGAKESVSRAGLLAFFERVDRRRQFAWYSRAGVAGPPIAAPSDLITFDLSPDERRIAVAQRTTSFTNLSILEVAAGTMSRVTVGDTRDVDPRWMPDGRTLLFGSMRDPGRSPHRVTPNGAPPSLVWKFDGRMFALDDVSRDGRWVLHHDASSAELRARLIDPTTRAGEARDATVIVARELTGRLDQAQFSPDGRWVAYSTDESGRPEVIVVPFPATGERFQVSRRGGVQPVWRGDGRELYYLSPDGALTAVPILPGPMFKSGEPAALFKTRLAAPAFAVEEFAASADGTRFLLLESVNEVEDLVVHVIVNWRSLLPR